MVFVLGSSEINADFIRMVLPEPVGMCSLVLAQLLLAMKYCFPELEGTEVLIPFQSSCSDFNKQTS